MALRKPDATIGPFREQTSVVLRATLMDTSDPPVAIPGASLNAATLTLYDEADPFDIINSRNRVDILSNIDTDGVLTFEFTPTDMLIQDDDELMENHRALIEWTYSTTKQGSFEIRIVVQNVLKVPA